MRIAMPVVSAFLLSSVWAGVAVAGAAYTYDALGRVISVRFDDGKQIVYSYDAAGNRTQENVSATTLNRAPVAVADAVTLTEDQSAVTLNPRTNDSDPDGNALTLFNAGPGDFGSGALSGGGTTVTYSSTYKRNAVDKIVYTITDGQGMNTSGEITVTLANLPPVANTDTLTVNFTGAIFSPLSNDTDPGGDTLTVTAVGAAAHGSTSLNTTQANKINYFPTFGYTGPDTFTYTIVDADGAVVNGTVNVTVTP